MVFNNLLRLGREAISPRPDILPSNTVMIQSSNDSLAKRTELKQDVSAPAKKADDCQRLKSRKKNPSRGGWFGFGRRRCHRRQLNQRGGSDRRRRQEAKSFSGGRERFWRRKGSELGRAWAGTDGLGGELFLSAAANQPAWPSLLLTTWHAFPRQGETCLPPNITEFANQTCFQLVTTELALFNCNQTWLLFWWRADHHITNFANQTCFQLEYRSLCQELHHHLVC